MFVHTLTECLGGEKNCRNHPVDAGKRGSHDDNFDHVG